MTKELITYEEANRLLNYDPETGVFTWKNSINGNKKKGDIAGITNASGYKGIRLYGRSYSAFTEFFPNE